MTILYLKLAVVAIAIISWVVSIKRNNSYFAPTMESRNSVDADETRNMLVKAREAIGIDNFLFDIFETDCVRFVFTNIGLVVSVDDTVYVIGYDRIKRIGVPSIHENVKRARKVDIETMDGDTLSLFYFNKKNNRFEELFDNIRRTGYPIPDYKGKRAL